MRANISMVVRLSMLIFINYFCAEPVHPSDILRLPLSGPSVLGNCQPTEPTKDGEVNQGGYSFTYKSDRGKGCRIYGLRNHPGKLLTPVRWKDTEETFFDTNLAECKNAECPWIHVRKGLVYPHDGRTTLSYGVNKDQYKDSLQAYREHEYKEKSQADKLQKEFPPLITVIDGTIADINGKPLELRIRVNSYVTIEGAQYQLLYEMSNMSESNDLQLPRPGAPRPGAPTKESFSLVWNAAATSAFFQALAETGGLRAGGEKVIVSLTSKGIEEERSKLLVVFQGTSRIFATTAPAYRPSER